MRFTGVRKWYINDQYNEVVLWGDRWEEKLPFIVEAFFFPVNGHVDSREGDQGAARRARNAFIQR